MRTFVAAFAGGLVSTVFTTMLVLAWTGPTSAPPNGNVAAPINVGVTDQVKNAGLSVNALAVFGNGILSGTSRYLNFGTLPGATGYGFRDNAGTMQYRNSSGSWTNITGAVAETDPQVGTLTNGRWCTTDGSTVNCTSVAPTTSHNASLTNCAWVSMPGTCTSGDKLAYCPSGKVVTALRNNQACYINNSTYFIASDLLCCNITIN